MRSASYKPSLLLFLSCLAFGTLLAQQESEVLHRVFLIGDAGEPNVGEMAHINLLHQQLLQAGEESTVIFLGDNIYPKGMPEEDHRLRQAAETSINGQLKLLDQYEGTPIFIGGNHDWQKGGKEGWTYIINQEKYVEAALDSTNVFRPSGGCPGPEEIHIGDRLVIIVFDSQWMFHPWDKPRTEEDCQAENTVALLELIQDAIERNQHKKILVAGHHPMVTYGIHGGTTTWKDHLFPLTEINENLYIPIPIIGSIYPFYRKYIGNIQDTQHPKYKAIRKELMGYFSEHPDLIYAAGHEHSLQYSYNDSVHYVVSGAGSKTTHVKKKGYAQFVAEKTGYACVTFYKSGRSLLEFWTTDENGKPEILYSKVLSDRPYQRPLSAADYDRMYDLSDSVIFTEASSQYTRKESRYWLLGKNYRDVWGQEVQVPLFDIGTVKGGLEILQKGGGMQTKSLRLEASDGKQYTLRTIEKFTEKAVPAALRPTFAADIVQDQISASHPFGAFVIPRLAEAAGIYHTQPRLYFVPDDPRLGKYRAEFAGQLVLFEQRPDDDWSDSELFGSSDKIYSTSKVVEELRDDNDNFVDEKWVVRSRLFDLLIGDWDRHDDQWRWSSFDAGKGRMFRPIPRDRDQAFFVNEGFLMNIAKRKWALPKFQGFDYEIDYTEGMMFNARYFDRDFLTGLSREDWLEAAADLQDRLTDEVIQEALLEWPDEVYELTGEEIEAKLKAIRNDLQKYALEHYLFLAKTVEVKGSDKNEYFRVERKENGDTRVRVYKMTKKDKKDKLLYDRTFLKAETREIRLYGFGNDDEFHITGKGKRGIRIRVIGGKGEDEITDESSVTGPLKLTHVYDKRKNTELDLGREGRDRTSNRASVNAYNRKSFRYNTLLPLITANYNVDDGIFIGGGFRYENHGFRKVPYKSRHKLMGSWAPLTNSWQFDYESRYTDVFGKWDFELNLMAQAPNYTTNFFGLGNNTIFNQNADEDYNLDKPIYYYRTRFEQYSTELLFSRRLGRNANFSLGGHWQGFIVSDDYQGESRFILEYGQQSGDPAFFDFKTYAGLALKFSVDTRNNLVRTTSGLHFDLDLRGYEGLNNASADFTRFQGSLAYYTTIRLPATLTLALRGGGGHNFGTSEFFQSQILGGKYFIRGYHRTRFMGDSKAYGNAEVRLKLFSFRNRAIPTSVGLNGFYDIGRVWLQGENSRLWHHGAGGGIWFAPLNVLSLNFEVAASPETTLFYFRFGFLY